MRHVIVVPCIPRLISFAVTSTLTVFLIVIVNLIIFYIVLIIGPWLGLVHLGYVSSLLADHLSLTSGHLTWDSKLR